MRQLEVGFDIDGVLYGFHEALKAYAVLHLGENPEDLSVPALRWDHHESAWGWSIDKFLAVCDKATDEGFLFTYGEPMEGIEAVNRIKGKGHGIHMITARGFGTKSAHNTADWLYRHNIRYDSLILTHHKSMIRPDIMIDDYEKNFVIMESVGVDIWLMDQPWNQHVITDKRVFSLSEFEEQVDRKASL